MKSIIPIKNALISVSDKNDLIPFVTALQKIYQINLISTGGTQEALQAAALPTTNVSDITQFPEMMDNRVKTLHPKIHGGILARRDQDAQTLLEHQIQPIDLVVVNLYPFEKTAQTTTDIKTLIQNIDVGGPAMIRGAAKNHEWVTVVVDPADYELILAELDAYKGIRLETRQYLAVKAFKHTAYYDSLISQALGKQYQQPVFSECFTLPLRQHQVLRYGENPHQQAYCYVNPLQAATTLANATPLQGKPLSFNNLNDADTALQCAYQFDEPACVIVKHANPCGAALGYDLLSAYQKAFSCDTEAAYGGIVACNQTVDAGLIDAIFSKQFVEVILAPDFTPAALAIAQQKVNCRLLAVPKINFQANDIDIKPIHGGVLIQNTDQAALCEDKLEVVGIHQPTPHMIKDGLFAWRLCKYVKSNAIVYVKDQQTVGIGAGQMRRVMSSQIGVQQAQYYQLPIEGAVMASDAFLPFPDNVVVAAKAGIRCIFQPGGSKRDKEVIEAANDLGVAMIFTHLRHFRH
jgi:phosphoribosylaminoimidazolecarboxamide formyltransferase/IMP cyclohydrolase